MGQWLFFGVGPNILMPNKGMATMQQNPKQPDNDNAQSSAPSNREKDPSDWVTGDEAMTGAQASYLKTLSEEANEPFDGSLNKGDASKRIDALRQATGKDAQTNH